MPWQKVNESTLQKLWSEGIFGAAEVSNKGEFINANPAFCDLVEYSHSELIGKTFQQITHPDDVAADSAMVQQVLDGNISDYIMSKRYLTKTGKILWITLKATPIRDENGGISYFLAQIAPAKEVSAELVSHTKITPKGTLTFDFFKFLKNNWKWAGAALFALISYTFTFYYQVQDNTKVSLANREAIMENTKTIQRIENDVERGNDKLDTLLNLMKSSQKD